MYALDELRRQVAELRRLVHLLWIIGPVAEIDAARRRVRVAYGDPAADPRPTTGWIPWSSERAAGPGDGESEWRPPAVGEVVMVACPEGNAALGVVVRSLPTLAAAPPSADLAVRAWRGADGAEISYDADAHALTAVLPAGGTAALTAPGGVTVTGDLTVTGDVLGGSVADGDGNLGEIRTIYNRHVHTVPPAGVPPGSPVEKMT